MSSIDADNSATWPKQPGVRCSPNSATSYDINFSLPDRGRMSFRFDHPDGRSLLTYLDTGKRRDALLEQHGKSGMLDFARYFPGCKYDRDRDPLNNDLPLSEYAAIIEKRKSGNYKSPDTLARYMKDVAVFVRLWKDPTISQITVQMFEHWYDTHTKLSLSRCKNMLIGMRMVIQEALRRGVIGVNVLDPATGFKPQSRSVDAERDLRHHDGNGPKKQIPESDLVAIGAELSAVVAELPETGVWTGLRLGELFGLRWSDIDFERARLHVRREVVNGRVQVPKTRASIRPLDLLPRALESLTRQYALTGHLKHGSVFVHPRTLTPFTDDQQFRKGVWLPACRAAGVSASSPKHLRHTFASRAISQGEPAVWISNYLGHTSVTFTERTYAQWFAEHQEAHAPGARLSVAYGSRRTADSKKSEPTVSVEKVHSRYTFAGN